MFILRVTLSPNTSFTISQTHHSLSAEVTAYSISRKAKEREQVDDSSGM
jgi:hypothetical protein